MSENKPHPLTLPHWGGIGAIAGVIGSIVAILTLIVAVWAILPSPKKDDKKEPTSTLPSKPVVETQQPQQPVVSMTPAVSTPESFVNIGQPRETHERIEVSPEGEYLRFPPSFRQSLVSSVDDITPRIRDCFNGYQATHKFEASIVVNVDATVSGEYVPRNEISIPDNTSLPDDDWEKVKDVISKSRFPTPDQSDENRYVDSYSFILKVTFVPKGS